RNHSTLRSNLLQTFLQHVAKGTAPKLRDNSRRCADILSDPKGVSARRSRGPLGLAWLYCAPHPGLPITKPPHRPSTTLEVQPLSDLQPACRIALLPYTQAQRIPRQKECKDKCKPRAHRASTLQK